MPTDRTSLLPATSDDLLLLDALFDGNDTLESLRRDHYAEWHNLPYTHGLDDAALDQAISRLRAAGLVRRVRLRPARRGDIWLGLTAAGGALWTRTRRPRWARYCIDASWPDEATGSWVLSVRSPSLATARAFLATAVEAGLYVADPSVASVRRRTRSRLVPWRTFATSYELRVPRGAERGGRVVAWTLYERQRVWWRSIGELGGTAT